MGAGGVPRLRGLIGSRCMLRVACTRGTPADSLLRCVRRNKTFWAATRGLSHRPAERFRWEEPLDAGANRFLQRHHASAEQIDAGAAVHGSLEGLQLVDLSFGLPVAAPTRRCEQLRCPGESFARIAAFRRFQMHARRSARRPIRLPFHREAGLGTASPDAALP